MVAMWFIYPSIGLYYTSIYWYFLFDSMYGFCRWDLSDILAPFCFVAKPPNIYRCCCYYCYILSLHTGTCISVTKTIKSQNFVPKYYNVVGLSYSCTGHVSLVVSVYILLLLFIIIIIFSNLPTRPIILLFLLSSSRKNAFFSVHDYLV